MRRSLAVLAAVGLAGCGGSTTLDESDGGEFDLQVARATFSSAQRVAAASDLVLRVSNADDKAIPQLTVTVWTGKGDARDAKSAGSFATEIEGRPQPVWLLDEAFPKADGRSAGGRSSLTDTYVFGGLKAGGTRTLVWRVTPVRAGSYRLNYAVTAGTGTETTASPQDGSFQVRVAAEPAAAN